MTLYEFQALPNQMKTEILWDLGVAVSEREDERYYCVLYCLHSFYVELKYSNGLLASVRGFDHTEPLEPYLSAIAIPLINYK
jgi:hypothetical protein